MKSADKSARHVVGVQEGLAITIVTIITAVPRVLFPRGEETKILVRSLALPLTRRVTWLKSLPPLGPRIITFSLNMSLWGL